MFPLLTCSFALCLGTALYAAAASELTHPVVRAGKFTEIFDPKAGEKEPWCINDHTFVHGPDGAWHLFGITHVVPFNFAADPGKHLLHATARTLTQSPWHKERFAVTADWDKHHEWLLWAPHVIRQGDLYFMFVCVGNRQGHQYSIHLLTSRDLWQWDRSPANPLLTDGFDARDPCVVPLPDERWAMYYTATSKPEGGHHIVACVTSPNLTEWGNRKVAFMHPRQGTFGGPTESPFVVRRSKTFYLFACDGGTINVYASQDPFHWDLDHRVGVIYAHASEVIRDERGKWFISHAGWEKGGLSLSPLIWEDGLESADAWPKPGS